MANRNIIHILKNSSQPNKPLPLPSLVQIGEALVNTADGKVYFKGFISGTGSTSYVTSLDDINYFEVGSHLSQLKLDDKIISYGGISGIGLEGKFLSGSTNGFEIVNISALQSSIDSYVSGGSFNNISQTLTLNLTNGRPNVDITGITTSDTFLTGATFNPTNSNLTLSQNGGTFSSITSNLGYELNKNITNLTASTINISGLTASSILYLDPSKNVKTDSGFNYNETTNTLTLPNDSSMTIGTGGLTIGSGGTPSSSGTGDLTVHGNLIVFGNSVSALTTELYVEDKNVIVNYNPTGDTSSNSLGAGITIQDGLGVTGATNDVFLQIAQTSAPTSIITAYENRFLESNLFNIMLGSSGGTGTGFYVIKESDILDGGSY